MDVYDQKAYKDLEAIIVKHRSFNSNLMVVSVPGTGASYLLKSYIAVNPDVHYITGTGQSVGTFNIIDMSENVDWEVVNEYFRSASNNQKFAWLVNDPGLLDSEEFGRGFAASHTYENYYLAARDKDDTGLICKEINKDLTAKELEKIFELSGGIPKLAKYFAVNKDKINQDLKTLDSDEGLKKITGRTLTVSKKCSPEVLEKLGIIKDGKYVSRVLELWQDNAGEGVDIKVEFDLSLVEDGVASKEKLTKEEKEILEFMVENGGEIDREKVAEIKWGDGSFEEFSDQAINKTMRRLSDQLERYEIKTIPKVGYQIKRRG